MASRRDQLQSHQFLAQRVISALVMRETDPAQAPLRRGIGAVFAGIMITVMVAAGFGVYGLLTQTGGSDWRTNGSVVIEKETGASFVFQDGQLHPMLNYASAMLVTGAAPRTVYREAASALNAVPRGVALGIPNAPGALPDSTQTVGAPWTLCIAGSSTTLDIGAAPAGLMPLGERGLLVREPTNTTAYLIWHGTRYAVTASVLSALFGAVTPATVGTAWLTSIPQGPDIAPLTISDSGRPSPAAARYDIGEVLATPIGTGGTQYWLVLSGGLAPISELQKDVAVSQGAPGPTTISSADATAIGRASLPDSSSGTSLPGRPPSLADPSGGACARFSGSGAPTMSIGAVRLPTGTPTGSRTANGTVLADRVAVPPGRIAVVRVLAAADRPANGYYLVTDLGIRYAVASDDVLKMLGYQPDSAIGMPAGLVQLIPVGPALDPAAAAQPVTVGIGGGN